ncbi:MAG: hypothetical protein KBD76_10625 [Bacteriovorax sp.]|jgi:hypothetical protein|nr:hypothetical protein [Bacteriovorax sp.]
MHLNRLKLTVLFCLLLTLSLLSVRAQGVLEDIEEEERIDSPAQSDIAPNLVVEKIKNISPSKKIFILTNENQSFSKGDFISLLLANKLVCRALVAKTTEDKLSGIKIVKIYNLSLWKQLGNGKEVLVLKGDDSYFTTKEKAPEKEVKKVEESKVQSDEDLFNSTSLGGNDDDLSIEENAKRLIKPDNLLSLNVGLIEGKDVDNSSKRYTQLNVSWGYQLTDNIWAEADVGTNTIRDYPYTNLDTRLINLTVRGKYTFSAPFYSYLQPYVGYQTILADSPSAGVDPGNGTRTTAELALEKQLVQDLKKSTVIFGVSVLKRIVPGWFIRLDLGSDILNGGLSIEF